jgi:predicted esterase
VGCKALKEQGIDVEFRGYDKDHTMLPEEVRDIREWLAGRMAEQGRS